MNSLANLVHEAQCADRMFQQTTKQYKKEVRLLQRKIGWYENILVDYQLLVDKLQKETLHKEKKVRKWKGRCRMLTAVQPIKREKKESKEKKLRKEPNEQTIDLTEDSVTQPPQMVDDVLDTIIEDALVKMDTGEVLITTQPVVAVVTETEEEEEVEVEEETEEEEVEVEVDEEEEEVEETEEEEEEEEEVFMVTIKGKQYFTNDETNGTIYSVVDEDDIGDEVGHYKNGVPVFA